MSTTLSPHRFPSAIKGKLQWVRWRHAATSLAFALAFACGVGLLLMFAAMGIDWLYPFAPTWLRMSLTAATAAAAIGVACRLGIGPVRRALHWARAADAVDHDVPELEERWSTVTSLSSRDVSQWSPIERAMAAQVTSEAIAMERIVQPRRVGPPVSLRPAVATAAVGAGCIAAMFAIAPQQTSVLMRRFLSPASLITATQLDSVTGDQMVPRGESLELIIRMQGVPRSTATLTIGYPDGRVQDVQLRPNETTNDQFTHSLRVDESMSYRVRAGDAQTPWHQLQVIDYPELEEVRLTIEFPEYTDRESVQRDGFPRRMKVVQGSVLRLSIKPVERLESCVLSLVHPNASPSATVSSQESTETVEHLLTADADNWYHFEMQLVEDVLLQPKLLSTHGLENRRRQFTRIDVIADKAPVARVIKPTDEMAVAEDATIDIEFEAHDDHGIATAELVIYDESQRDTEGNAKVLKVQPISLDEQTMQRHVMGKTTLDLKELGLTEGQQISYAVRVTDNRNVRLSDDREATPQTALAEREADATNRSPLNASAADPEALANPFPSDKVTAQESGDGLTKTEPMALATGIAAANPNDPQPAANAVGTHNQSPSDKVTAQESGDGQTKSEPMAIATGIEAANPNDPQPAANAVGSHNQSPSDKVTAQESGDGQTKSEPMALATGIEATNPNDPQPAANAVGSHNQSPSDKVTAQESGDGQTKSEPMALATGIEATNPNDPQPAANAVGSHSQALPSAQAGGEASESVDMSQAASAENVATSQKTSKPAMQSETAETRPSATDNPLARSQSSLANVSQSPQSQNISSSNGTQQSKTASPDRSGDIQSPSPETATESRRHVRNASPMLTGQRSRQGQNTLTGRRRLKITATLSALADAEDRPGDDQTIRESVVEIDRMLTEIEMGLQKLVDGMIADADRGEQLRRLDAGLGNVETFVADLREQTKENQFAFVGLQMVDITRTHITPARDRVFAGSQRPGASDVDAKMGLQHVLRARELLAALLKRYDRVEQEKKLEEEMDEAVTMYEVYVQKRRQLMREARQNLNPLDRKMGIIEVDQAYLDRLAEVIKLRREMMDEFAQMLGDDPRLLSRYMELTKRRQASLRDQLTEIAQRQFDMTEETLNWLQIDDSQRADLWMVIIELRLAAADDLAKDASELAERVEKQMPLDVELAAGTPAEIIAQTKQIASAARTIRMDADDVAAEYGKAKDPNQLRGNASSLVLQCERLFALLDRLQFENNGNEGINQYVESRIQESRAVADQAALWMNLSNSIASDSYPALVETEQHRLAITTQLLRVSMLEMESDLVAQFQRILDTDLPGEIKDMIRTLHRLMESITFNQLAASFRSGQGRLEPASEQQQLASDRLSEAEALFDQIRRAVVERLDENDPNDPNIADLQDPTLDAFLAQLEREPNIAAQLGIPNRRSNLRIRADTMLWQQSPLGALAMSANAAGERARQAMKMQRKESDADGEQGKPKKPEDRADKPEPKELSPEEQQQREAAKEAQDRLTKTLAEIEKQQQDSQLPREQRERLEKVAEDLRRLLDAPDGDQSAQQAWDRVVQADQANELMRAMAAGESIPDEQWNRLLSTLDDGLWQTRGNRPPEAYRKAIEQYQDQIRELLPTVDE
ncbi:hypothetical protein [Neorhodopirellula pilleata]|uniref:Myosin heavy chain n=1 Tax=Neorhodopirellula pilleata TaxID=2714738 RepID=A0A5C6AQD2_9BACT|nr:hypothetical protein [Neorhodopirellula pilleata]TWU01651.1 hypothetical protein Pla100_13860 [Neorhodopirellula pilleata]